MQNKKTNLKDLILIAIFSAIICVVSPFSIPMPFGVPMTLQTFIIPLTAIILGTKRGVIATCIYILLGIVGIPVFSNFSSGLAMILGPTGGFIISFPILALTAGIGCDKNKFIFAFYLILGACINYFIGLLVFTYVSEFDLITSISYCIIPFIPTTIIKIILLLLFGKKIKNSLLKHGISLQ